MQRKIRSLKICIFIRNTRVFYVRNIRNAPFFFNSILKMENWGLPNISSILKVGYLKCHISNKNHLFSFQAENGPKFKTLDFGALKMQILSRHQILLSHTFWGISCYSPYQVILGKLVLGRLRI